MAVEFCHDIKHFCVPVKSGDFGFGRWCREYFDGTDLSLSIIVSFAESLSIKTASDIRRRTVGSPIQFRILSTPTSEKNLLDGVLADVCRECVEFSAPVVKMLIDSFLCTVTSLATVLPVA